MGDATLGSLISVMRQCYACLSGASIKRAGLVKAETDHAAKPADFNDRPGDTFSSFKKRAPDSSVRTATFAARATKRADDAPLPIKINGAKGCCRRVVYLSGVPKDFLRPRRRGLGRVRAVSLGSPEQAAHPCASAAAIKARPPSQRLLRSGNRPLPSGNIASGLGPTKPASWGIGKKSVAASRDGDRIELAAEIQAVSRISLRIRTPFRRITIGKVRSRCPTFEVGFPATPAAHV